MKRNHCYPPVVLGISRLTGGAESLAKSSLSMGSKSVVAPVQVTPSIHLRASGPSLRISACNSFSFSISAFRKRQLVFLTSRSRCSSSHTEESRRFLDMGRNVARTRLSTTPWGLRLSSTSWNLLDNYMITLLPGHMLHSKGNQLKQLIQWDREAIEMNSNARRPESWIQVEKLLGIRNYK